VSQPSHHGVAAHELASALGLGVLYGLSALAGAWAAFDRGAAERRLVLLAAGLALMLLFIWVGRSRGQRSLAALTWLTAPAAALVGGYFLLSHDWAAQSDVKIAWVWRLGRWWQMLRPTRPLPDAVHPNVAAGALIILIPLGLGATWALCDHPFKRRDRILALASALLMAPALSALLLSGSRGAWLGLIMAAPWAAYICLAPKGRFIPAALIALLLLPLLAFLLTLFNPALDAWWGGVGAGDSFMSRAALWRNALILIRDYPFTGSGLGMENTTWVYSTYALLLNVSFLPHVHNLFLQIAVAQGLAGLFAFVGLMMLAARAGWTAKGGEVRERALKASAMAALVAFTVHGLGDAGLYASRLAPLTFLPLGFSLALAPARTRPFLPRILRPLPALLALLLALSLWLPVTQAAFRANLGSVAQTQAELSVYDFETWRFQDALRRDPSIDLDPAIRHYQAALQLNPHQETALRRLGQIALSRGDYATAREYLEAAARQSPQASVTRKLLGEAYAATGRVDEAAALWSEFIARPLKNPVDYLSLQIRVWWHESLGEADVVRWMDEALGAGD